jgi:AcrR family transcriptional regulator
MKRVDLGPAAPPWPEQLRMNVLHIATILAEERELTQMLYNHALGLDEDFDRKIREFYQNLTNRVEGAFRLGQEMGLLRPELHTRLATYHVIGSVKEVIYHLAKGGDLDLTVEAMVNELLSYYNLGLLKSQPKPQTAKPPRKK